MSRVWDESLNPYEVLELSTGISSTEADIKKAYRRLARLKHPDKNPNAKTEDFHLIHSAYEILCDEAARSAYDTLLQARQLNEERWTKQSQKRRKMREDLERREKASFTERHEEAAAQAALHTELRRLRKKLEAETTSKLQSAKNARHPTEQKSLSACIKLKWIDADTDWTEARLTAVLKEWVEVSHVALKCKKNGQYSAVAELGKASEVQHLILCQERMFPKRSFHRHYLNPKSWRRCVASVNTDDRRSFVRQDTDGDLTAFVNPLSIALSTPSVDFAIDISKSSVMGSAPNHDFQATVPGLLDGAIRHTSHHTVGTPAGMRTYSGSQVDWASLPGNVIDCVLMHVPFKQKSTLRTVCHQWCRHIDQGIRTLTTNAKYPSMMPVTTIAQRFPMITTLDLSCQTWGFGQSLTPSSCVQLGSLGRMSQLRSVKLVNWSTLPLSGFKIVAGLPCLEELDVTYCVAITDNYLSCFRSASSNLQSLCLTGCERITDAGIMHLTFLKHLTELRLANVAGIVGETLCRLNPRLECLDVSFCEKLTDAAIKSLIQQSALASNLKQLNLSGCQNMKSGTLASLFSLSRLTRMKMSYMPQLIEIRKWSQLMHLQVLDVSFASGLNMQEALPVIGEMTQLRSLRMNGCRRTQGLQPQQLAALKNVKGLEISQWSNIQFGLDVADVLPNLEVLDLSGCYGTINNSKEYFQKSTNLKILGLSKIASLPSSVMKGIGCLPSIEVLNLYGLGNMSNRVIEEICKATTLKYLDLSQNGIFCKVTNKGALHLQALKCLKRLRMTGWTEVTHHGFTVFKSLPGLTSLDVSSCSKITDKILKSIAHCMPELNQLNLMNCFQVTCMGLGALRKLSNLSTLKLSTHMKGDIESQLPKLKNLQLVSPLGAAELWEDHRHPSNFQHVLDDYSNEDGTRCYVPSLLERI